MTRLKHNAGGWRRLRLDRLRGDRGDTLVEVMVTISILGIAMVAITGGMATSIVTSDIHHKQAVSGMVLTNFAEAVQAAPYVACPAAAPASYATATVTGTVVPSGYTTAIVSTTAMPFEYASGGTPPFQSGCPGTDQGAQRIWLSASSNDGRDVETVQIVKRTP
jgi:prepilin-type N-terminal cleavage/methylation domain-containing protein